MLDFIAERRIAEAIKSGEFEDLPGAGKPLELDDDSLVPEELREIAALERLVTKDSTAARKLALLKARIEARYYEKAVSAFSRARRSTS